MVSVAGDNSEQHTVISIDEALSSEVFKAKLVDGGFHFLRFDFVSGMIKMVSASSFEPLITSIQDSKSGENTHLRVLVIPSTMKETLAKKVCRLSIYILGKIKYLCFLHRKTSRNMDSGNFLTRIIFR